MKGNIGTVVKRAIWTIPIILLGAYIVNTFLENKAKREAEESGRKRIEETVRASVAQLVARTNAIDTWEQALCKGEEIRWKPILTVELERLWLTDRPILFMGTIEDISTADSKNYRIEVQKSLLSGFAYILGTKLRLILQCPKQEIDSFLKAHPDLFKVPGLTNGVAVIAKIEKIETKLVSAAEGETEEMKIGKGKWVDMTFTGKVTFLTHTSKRP